MQSDIELSIILPAYNEAGIIRQTLEKVSESVEGIPGIELIVCDNNSTDQTADIALKAGAKVIHEPINQISRARNTGASIAKGKWFLFIDADTYPESELMRAVIEGIGQDNMIGFGSTVKAIDGPLWARLRLERLNPSMRLFKWTGGAFLGCEAEAFSQLGGFSDSLYAYEEIEFVRRLKKYGRKQGKSFTIFHKHPVFTSARKGDIWSFPVLVLSTLSALILLLLHSILPSKWMRKTHPFFLGFWYKQRRE
ncbi:MAG: glycosyltransferase [Bacteroidota bacterium]